MSRARESAGIPTARRSTSHEERSAADVHEHATEPRTRSDAAAASPATGDRHAAAESSAERGDLSAPTVGDICRVMLATAEREVVDGLLAKSTLVHYLHALKIGALEHLAEVPARELRPHQIAVMRRAIHLARGPSAANHCVNVLGRAYNEARMHGVVDHNPAAAVRRLPQQNRRIPVEPEQGRKVAAFCWDAFMRPTRCDGHALRNTCIGEVMAALFLVLMTTGLRVSEATHLRVSEYDARSGVLTITKHKTTRRGAPPKRLHLGAIATRILDTIVARQLDPEWMFPVSGTVRSKSGHIEDPHSAWKRLLRHLELPEEIRIHDIRHGFASAAYASCGDLKAVQTMLAHANIATTSRYVGAAPGFVVRPIADKTASLLVGDLGNAKPSVE